MVRDRWFSALGATPEVPHGWNQIGEGGQAIARQQADGSVMFLGWCDRRLAAPGIADAMHDHRPFFVDLEVTIADFTDLTQHVGPGGLEPLAVRRIWTTDVVIHKERVFATRDEATRCFEWIKVCVDSLSDEELAACYRPGVMT